MSKKIALTASVVVMSVLGAHVGAQESAPAAVPTAVDEPSTAVGGERSTPSRNAAALAEEDGEAVSVVDLFNTALNIQLYFLAVFSIVGTVLGWLGFRELRSIRSSAEEAGRLTREAGEKAAIVETHLAQVKKAAEPIMSLSLSTLEIQRRVMRAFDRLDLEVFAVVVGQKLPPLDPEILTQLEDLDNVLYAIYHLDLLPDREAASRALIKLGRFHRRQLDFARSVERIRLADQLAPESMRPLIASHLGVTLSNWAAWQKLQDPEQRVKDPEELLRQAWLVVEGIPNDSTVERADILYLRGVILLYQEHLLKAAEAFREALEALETKEVGRENVVETTPTVVRYNLAVSLCLAGKLEEALGELLQLPQSEQSEALRDPDFGDLLKDERLGPQLRAAAGE